MEGAPGVWKLGTSSTISWPATSRGGNGNGGVAQIVKCTPGAIGYVDYADAKASGLTYASIKNQAGELRRAVGLGGDRRRRQRHRQARPDVQRDWSPGATAYPITAQSWVLVYQKQSSANTTKMLKAYIGYLVGAGQQLLPGLGYAPLPSSIDSEGQGAAQQDRFVVSAS